MPSAPKPILEIAAKLGLGERDLEPYGTYKAKLSFEACERLSVSNKTRGKLIFVTAITPTKAGEGKTTVSIGLAQAMCRTGKNAVAALRQASLGPFFGMKGGASGGGQAQLLPAEDLNLHFTGDLHAIAAANNLLAALIDNQIFHGNQLNLDPRSVSFRRALDMNDRNLRTVVTGLGGKKNGYPMETGFDITAASEVMAVLCLSESYDELREKLACIVIGQTQEGAPVTAGRLGGAGAMALLLKDAMKPNLVQTSEGSPAFVHGGPFANIAHGCSSIMATKVALKLADFVITEGGFGADLGFEKYCNIIASTRAPELVPDAVVLVATTRALKLHGGVEYHLLDHENTQALKDGLANLDRHIDIVGRFHLPCVVAVNKHKEDSDAELKLILEHCKSRGVQASICDVFAKGGAGGLELAEQVALTANTKSSFRPLYKDSDRIMQKLEILARDVYGADSVSLSAEAEKQVQWLSKHGFESVPVCVAKTQYSLSDDPELLCAPKGFEMKVRSFHLSAGAGFVVAQMGDILTMPGLPRHPQALEMDIDAMGNLSLSK